MLAGLAADGRTSVADLSRMAKSTPARISRRLQLMLDSGALYFDVEISAISLGYHAPANLWLRVDPVNIKDVGRALAQMPEIGFTSAISGPQNLVTVAHCQDLDELFEFSCDRIGMLPGVESVEVSPIFKQVKQIGVRLAENGQLEPARRWRPESGVKGTGAVPVHGDVRRPEP